MIRFSVESEYFEARELFILNYEIEKLGRYYALLVDIGMPRLIDGTWFICEITPTEVNMYMPTGEFISGEMRRSGETFSSWAVRLTDYVTEVEKRMNFTRNSEIDDRLKARQSFLNKVAASDSGD